MVEGAKRQKTPNEIALEHPAGRHDDHLSAGRASRCCRSRLFSVQGGRSGHADHGHGAGGAAGLSDSHDDRRAAVGHRHRRNGSHDPGQRDCHVGPSGRSRRRRRRAAAGQDRHHHAGQSPGRRLSARPTACRIEALADAAQLASLADETPEGRSIVVLAKTSTDCAAATCA